MAGYHVTLTKQQEDLLVAYRKRRRIERGGKVITNATAIQELIAHALANVDPIKTETYDGILLRLEALESKFRY